MNEMGKRCQAPLGSCRVSGNNTQAAGWAGKIVRIVAVVKTFIGSGRDGAF